ncbi:Metallo-hydrolase oxidoreductase [Lentinula edodes]|uniref:hydroxyacylglutathione hydrolase n=1 Tax=Lentinula edodes TaxID=5353 RepID=A0A1Q3EGB2_LENED|nr:Metallo-hydrolase oxidoreductase [Lentinula edodes]
MQIVPVPVRQDNYAYLLIDEASKTAAAVDPYDVNKVVAAADNLGVQLVAGITTHHHFDHSGGNKEFVSKFPGVPIYGGSDKIPALTNLVKDKDEFTLGDIHIKLYLLLCHRYCVGSEMDAALSYLGTLPDSTIVYNGHEYTNGSLAFAKSIEPENKAFAKLDELVKSNEIVTGLTTIREEKEWNIFMRLGNATVRQAAGVSAEASASVVMDALREKKNNFRG